MKRILLFIALLTVSIGTIQAQTDDYVDLDKIAQIAPDDQKKIDAALKVADAVEKTGKFTKSLSAPHADRSVQTMR